MQNPSPLRYPGGKYKLAEFIGLIIESLDMKNCTYIEPFAGGSGVALSLLLNEKVENIVINDYDKSIYSFWRAVKEQPDSLIALIEDTPVTIEEWYHQKEIYVSSASYSIEFAFATLFLNRTNRSGILTAGPIGGHSQSGVWKLDVRFNKNVLINKIRNISNYRSGIHVYNKDIISLLKRYTTKFGNNAFYYFDPPYYNKGQKLYKNFFNPNDHKRICNVITKEITAPWIMTYDDVEEIEKLYNGHSIKRFDLTYSAANKGIASELMIFSKPCICPTEELLAQNKIKINLR